MIRRTPAGGAARRPPRPSLAGAVLGLAVLLPLLAAPAPVLGHGTAIDLAFWGDFPAGVARCQRSIGRAAAACGLRVWRARRDCALAPLRGAACDQEITAAAIEAARISALDDVSRRCTQSQLGMLQFLDLREAQADVIRFCRELDASATSLLLEPLSAGLAAEGVACAEQATVATTKLLGAAFRSRQHVLARIAARAIPARGKRAMADRSTADIAAAASRLADVLSTRCSAEAFAVLYDSGIASVLAAVASRADCLAGDAYAQGGILCPPSVCGNRMREGPEECDDGNAIDGDGCSGDCRREALTSGSRS